VIGYAKQKLLAAGALDVFSTAIQMKKDRPGVLLSVICRIPDRERMEELLFSETATFGIRRQLVERSKRMRRSCTISTPWGPVLGKLGEIHRQTVFTPEFDSCAKLAAQFNVPLRDVYQAAEEAFRRNPVAHDPESPAADSGDKIHDHSHDHGDEHGHDHGHDHSHDHDHHH
jgi:uncharacterized protein (DUF111 family)